MNEDFVTYELAVKLKEKGFREPCIAHYCCLDGNVLKFNTTIGCIRGSNFKCLNDENNIYTDAPTISQVLKWLREEKKMHICIDIYDDGWFFDIASFYKEDTGVYEIELPYKSSNVTPDYDSFEEAALAGIEYVLDNLI